MVRFGSPVKLISFPGRPGRGSRSGFRRRDAQEDDAATPLLSEPDNSMDSTDTGGTLISADEDGVDDSGGLSDLNTTSTVSKV